MRIVNPKMISSIEFSAGGFENKFGDKLSSVLNIEYKKPKQRSTMLTMSTLGLEINSEGQKTAKNTVVIRPGKLDRSPCGTGTSARLALLRKKNKIEIGEKIISQSIIGSTFETFIESENQEFSKMMIRPNIKGSAFITGEQILYKDDEDPFPQGYRLNDTWPDNI